MIDKQNHRCASPQNGQRTISLISLPRRHQNPRHQLPLHLHLSLLLPPPPLQARRKETSLPRKSQPCLPRSLRLLSTPCTAISPNVRSAMPPDRKSHLIFHRCAVAEAVKEGVESAGGSATIFQYVLSISSIAGHYLTSVLALMCRIAETLPAEVLTKLYAPAKPNYPIITPEELVNFDAFLFGIPTRYGNFPAQWKVRYLFSISL